MFFTDWFLAFGNEVILGNVFGHLHYGLVLLLLYLKGECEIISGKLKKIVLSLGF
jgi:hypothetical protein